MSAAGDDLGNKIRTLMDTASDSTDREELFKLIGEAIVLYLGGSEINDLPQLKVNGNVGVGGDPIEKLSLYGALRIHSQETDELGLTDVGILWHNTGTVITYRGDNSYIIKGKTGSVFEDNFVIDTTGKIGIGKIPNYQLELSTDNAAKPGTNTWTVVSDKRVKKCINKFKDGLDVVKEINPVTFKYNGKAGFKDTTTEQIGVIGQEIKNVAPYTINEFDVKLNKNDKENTTLLNFNSHGLIFVLINAVKELAKKVEILESKKVS